MKKLFSVIVAACCFFSMVNAQEDEKSGVEFSYEAGAEVVSSYLWRGQYNGGLSFQPTVSVGYEGENTAFSIGAWGSVGASDWGFRKGLEETDDCNPNTYFVKELDITGSFSFYNVSIGFCHYYYFDGAQFFSKGTPIHIDDDERMDNSSMTEVNLGYDFSHMLPDNHSLSLTWNTFVAGNDFVTDADGEFVLNDEGYTKRNFSSYLELSYDYTFEETAVTLGAQVGLVPWKSNYYGNDQTAVKCLSFKANKEWEFDHVTLDLFAQGMVDPDALAKKPESAFIQASGDNKICCQTYNATIGFGIWF